MNLKELISTVKLGDGKDEELAARQMNFPFWRISSHNDLVAFYNALDMGFMWSSETICESNQDRINYSLVRDSNDSPKVQSQTISKGLTTTTKRHKIVQSLCQDDTINEGCQKKLSTAHIVNPITMVKL